MNSVRFIPLQKSVNNVPTKQENEAGIHITWPEPSPVKFLTQNSIKDLLIKKGSWGFLNPAEVEELTAQLVPKVQGNITVEQAINMRSTLLQEKAMKVHGSMMQNAENLIHQYTTQGYGILEISCYMDYPPVACLRTILSTTSGLSKKNVKRMLKEGIGMTERDKMQLSIAAEHDLVAGVDQDINHEMADDFEDKIGRFLTSNGVLFKTQTQQQSEMETLYGNPTPDYLFESPLFINGKRIYWMDAKNYFGLYTNIQLSRLDKQMKRYTAAFGPGAIVWRLGYCDRTQLSGVTMLNAHYILEHMGLTPPVTPIPEADTDSDENRFKYKISQKRPLQGNSNGKKENCPPNKKIKLTSACTLSNRGKGQEKNTTAKGKGKKSKTLKRELASKQCSEVLKDKLNTTSVDTTTTDMATTLKQTRKKAIKCAKRKAAKANAKMNEAKVSDFEGGIVESEGLVVKNNTIKRKNKKSNTVKQSVKSLDILTGSNSNAAWFLDR